MLNSQWSFSIVFLYLFFGIFAAAGLACGAWGVSNLLDYYQIRSEGIKTVGTVIDLDVSHSSKGSSTYAPIVTFLDNHGDSIRYQSNTYSSSNYGIVGETRILWYNPDNPEEQVVLEGEGWTTWFPFIFLLTHGGVGIGGLVYFERKRRLKKWLLESGQEIQARFVEVITYRGKSTSYTIVCTWTDPFTGVGYDFKSESLRSNPEFQIGTNAMLRVFIDPANPKRYWVDTSFLR